jgi:hypothetical protein
VLGVADQSDVWQLDAIVRFGRFHRLEFGHFELGRESAAVLLEDLTIGEETFPAGSQIYVVADAKVSRLAYSFSLMNDAQKELGVMAGVHVTKHETDVVSTLTGQSVNSTLSTPLPVIGVHGSVSLGSRTKLAARLQLFRMEFDHYEGSLNYVYVGVQHFFSEWIGAGLGYNYYAMNLDSADESLRGSLKMLHQGPMLYASFQF